MLENLEEDDEIESLFGWQARDIARQDVEAELFPSGRRGFLGAFQSQNAPAQTPHAIQEHPGPATDLEDASRTIEQSRPTAGFRFVDPVQKTQNRTAVGAGGGRVVCAEIGWERVSNAGAAIVAGEDREYFTADVITSMAISDTDST